MMKKYCVGLFFSAILFGNNAVGNITLPAFISSGMVLQQKTEVSLWGTATGKNIIVTTSWNKKTYTAKPDNNGKWKIKISTPAAGGPYEILFSDGSVTRLTNILSGEVWIASGQSNMEMPVKGMKNLPVLHSNDLLLESDNDQIRLFRLEKISTGMPREDVKGKWQSASPGSVKDFSAVAYVFAKLLQQNLKVPVGIIETAWGGTRIEAWMSRNSLDIFPEIQLPEAVDKTFEDKNTPSGLFNGMIAPLAGYGIKGAIWYQGEQNRLEPQQYARLFPAMVKEWRSRWNSGEWPFYYVQIAPYTYSIDSSQAMKIPLFREVQLQAMQDIPNSGIAISMDAGDSITIHPRDKYIIGKRLVYWALSKTYDKTELACAGPVYKSMNVTNSRILLRFDNAENGLTSFGKGFSCFEIAGEDRIFYPATARISRDGLFVNAAEVEKPVAVRYAFKPWVKGDLYNTEGLPASSFRTDKWDVQ